MAGTRGWRDTLAAVGGAVAGALEAPARVLAVEGEAGIGKSTLLAEIERAARDAGATVLATRGTAADAEIGFAGLLTFLRPVESRLDVLAGDGHESLRSALTLGGSGSSAGGGGAAAGAGVGLGVYRVLTSLADAGPVLVVVDDAHLLDRSTSDALGFALGRLGVDPVAAVLAGDGPLAPALASAVHESIPLGGLDDEELAALVRAEGVIDDEAVARCCRFAGGNPLAARLLARALDDDQRTGRAAMPEVPRPPEAIARGFVRQLEAVGEPARRAMVVVAADDTGDLGVLRRALARLGEPSEALDDAERAGLLRSDGSQVRLLHPLLRAVAYHQVAPASRRAAHAALAESLGRPEQAVARAWQLAAAVDGPDESAAAALALVAGDLARRGGPASAARVLERSASLTPDDRTRGERFAASAEWWVAAFDLDAAGRVLELALDADDGDADRLVALQRVAAVVPDADRALERVARTAERLGSSPAVRAVRADLAVEVGGAPLVDELLGPHPLDDGDVEGADPSVRMLAAVVAARAAGRALPDVEVVPAGPSEGRPRPRSRLAEVVALRLALLGAERGLPWADPATATPPGSTAELVAARARARLQRGDLDGAHAELRTALAVVPARAHGLRVPLLLVLAELDHLHGRSADADERLAEVASVPIGSALEGEVIVHAGRVRGRDALDGGDPVAAADALAEAARRRPAVAGAELAVALAAAGRRTEAARWVERLLALDDPGPSTVVAREVAAGVVRDDPERVARAAADADAAGLAVAAVDARLAGAELLARAGLADASRDLCLRLERETAELGLRCWRGRIGRLRQPVDDGPPPAASLLTAAEHRVAEAVAGGGTNREAAAELFLSVKTVDFHLQNIYRKLGVRSRTELAVRLSRERGDDRGVHP